MPASHSSREAPIFEPQLERQVGPAVLVVGHQPPQRGEQVDADPEQRGEPGDQQLRRGALLLAAPAAVGEERRVEGERRGPGQPREEAPAQPHPLAEQADGQRDEVRRPGVQPVGDRQRHHEEDRESKENHRVPGSRRPSASGLPVRRWRASRLRSTRSLNQPEDHLADEHGAEDQQQLPAGPTGQRGGDRHADRGEQRLARVRGPDQQERREVAQRERRLLGPPARSRGRLGARSASPARFVGRGGSGWWAGGGRIHRLDPGASAAASGHPPAAPATLSRHAPQY